MSKMKGGEVFLALDGLVNRLEDGAWIEARNIPEALIRIAQAADQELGELREKVDELQRIAMPMPVEPVNKVTSPEPQPEGSCSE